MSALARWMLAAATFCSVNVCFVWGAEANRVIEAPPPMDALYADHVAAESARFLSINLFNTPVDPSKASDPSSFVIVSDDDPGFAPAKRVHPVAAGSRARAVRVALRKDLLVRATNIFLQLPQPMKAGRHYSVRASGIFEAVPALPAVLFDDTRQISDNIHLNQLGYPSDVAKRAYLGQYMGDAGAMPFDADTFHLIDADGKTVFTGKPMRRNVAENVVGQAVYELDFTAFRTAGTYRIHVPGVGVSYAFEIGPRAINPLFTNYMRGHYHQRCGAEVSTAYSRHARGACHLDDAFIDEAVEKTNFVKPKNPPLYPTRYDGRQQKAVGGHHDAGDYGKYTITGTTYVASVLNAMAAFPGKFQDDNTGLPSSGNGIPDIIDECKWELDWLENMQDEDGGVFGVIRPRGGGYEHALPAKEAKRQFFPKDTVFTAAYAAALAKASCSPVMRKYYPQDCDRYLAKAKRAWDWLQANTRYVQYFHYGAVFEDWDERCWAAVELYGATGDDAYHKAFLQQFDPAKKRWGWWPLFDSAGHTTHAYALMANRPRDDAMLQRCKAAIKEACEMHVADTEALPYRLSFPAVSIRQKNYGWHFPGDYSGFDLLLGYAQEKDSRYLQCAFDNLSYTCGANPSGHFLQTGLGSKRNIEVVSDYANNDNIIEPVPGLPLGIGSAGMYWVAKYGNALREGTYPAEWPLLNRWYDGFNVSTEFTMGPMMRETLVAAYFSEMPKGAAQRPTIKITSDQTSGAAPLAVQFGLESSARLRQVFWDFGDETFSTQSSPTHVFSDAGRRYPVGVSAVDENGMWAYATTQVNCLLAKAPFDQNERKADAKTIALYHFNGNLDDASKHLPALTPVVKKADRTPHRFDSEAPMWMSKPGGSCLVLDGAEHFIVTIPQALVPKAAETPFTIEMMLYLDEFAGWGYEGNPKLLGLYNDWDSALAWTQETWDKGQAPKFGDAKPEKFAKSFPRGRWCHVKLAYDGKRKSTLLIDGEIWGTLDVPPFKANLNKPLTLSVGPFRGMIDELVVRTAAE